MTLLSAILIGAPPRRYCHLPCANTHSLLPVCPSPPVPTSLCLSVCLSASLRRFTVFLSVSAVFLSVYASVRLSLSLSACLSVIAIFLSLPLSTPLSVNAAHLPGPLPPLSLLCKVFLALLVSVCLPLSREKGRVRKGSEGNGGEKGKHEKGMEGKGRHLVT